MGGPTKFLLWFYRFFGIIEACLPLPYKNQNPELSGLKSTLVSGNVWLTFSGFTSPNLSILWKNRSGSQRTAGFPKLNHSANLTAKDDKLLNWHAWNFCNRNIRETLPEITKIYSAKSGSKNSTLPPKSVPSLAPHQKIGAPPRGGVEFLDWQGSTDQVSFYWRKKSTLSLHWKS